MIIASYNSREGFPLDAREFAHWTFCGGFINHSQKDSLAKSLFGWQPENLHVEKVGNKLWVTVLSKRGAVWTWSIGPRGKTSSPNIDASESGMSVIEAWNTQA